MEHNTLFDEFRYLQREELDLPLHNAIPNINELLIAAHCTTAELDAVMFRYKTAVTQAQSLILSRNIECDPKKMLVEWHNLRTDANNLLVSLINMDNFYRITRIPFSTCPVCIVGGTVPKYIWDLWSVVVASQFFLPLISACKQKYAEVTGKKLSYANMLCLVENLFGETFTDGWSHICSKVYHVVNETAGGELLGVFILKGLTSVSFNPMLYLDMRDVDRVIETVMDGLQEFKPKVLPPTEMF